MEGRSETHGQRRRNDRRDGSRNSSTGKVIVLVSDGDAKTLMRAQQRGQTGSLYGNNPFEQPAEEGEEGEQQPQDTTKKERKIRKPLESYFFSDSVRSLNNFRWNVRRDYNRVEIGPLDTTLTDWRIDYPFYREEVGDIAQALSDRLRCL